MGKAKINFHKPAQRIFIPCVNTFLPCPICAIGHQANHSHNVLIYKSQTNFYLVRTDDKCDELELGTYLACFETINTMPFSIRAGRDIGIIPVYLAKDFNFYITQMKNKIILLSS